MAIGKYGIGLIATLFLSSSVYAATLRMVIQPDYNPDQSKEVYKPLADYLKTKTGHNITLVTPRNYHAFWREMRANTGSELVFEEAHFVDYRSTRFKYEPLVRTFERTSYTIIANEEVAGSGLKGLIGKNVVTMPSPSLGYALLTEMYPNPISQPNILSIAQSWRDGVEIVFAGEADAAVIPTWLKDQYPNLIPIQTSRELTGAAISASATLDPKIKIQIRDALLTLHEDANFFSVLNELGVTKFELASASEYVGDERTLRNFFGYK